MTQVVPRAPERGSATVLVALGCSVAVVLLVAGMALASAALAAHRARAASDLAALAGATAVRDGGAGCQVAADLAAANGATLTACVVAGAEVELSVQAPVILTWPGAPTHASARARAGPGDR